MAEPIDGYVTELTQLRHVGRNPLGLVAGDHGGGNLRPATSAAPIFFGFALNGNPPIDHMRSKFRVESCACFSNQAAARGSR
jgi:hypothetical protein